MENTIYLKPLRHMWNISTCKHPFIENLWIMEATRTDKDGYQIKVERTYNHAPTQHDTLQFYLHLVKLTYKKEK